MPIYNKALELWEQEAQGVLEESQELDATEGPSNIPTPDEEIEEDEGASTVDNTQGLSERHPLVQRYVYKSIFTQELNTESASSFRTLTEFTERARKTRERNRLRERYHGMKSFLVLTGYLATYLLLLPQESTACNNWDFKG